MRFLVGLCSVFETEQKITIKSNFVSHKAEYKICGVLFFFLVNILCSTGCLCAFATEMFSLFQELIHMKGTVLELHNLRKKYAVKVQFCLIYEEK